ncbi:hypothetical protein ACFFRR_008480 [Megaselia abdita]
MSNGKETKAQESEDSVESEFYSAQELFDDQTDSLRKSVKFEDGGSLLEEIIEVERVDEVEEENENEKSRPIRLDFLPKTSVFIDDQELQHRIEPEIDTSETPKSELPSEEQKEPSIKSSKSSIEAYQFVKRYSTSKMGELGNTLVTDAFIYMVIPPDGGFAWVILMVSFTAQAVVDGVVYCVAPLMMAIKEDVHFQNSELALITSCQTGFYFCCGPIASAAMNKFGFRKVGMAGGLISATGILIGSFMSNYIAFLVCYGIITGCGVGMVWAASQLVIGYYFEKYRPVANGIGSAGSGLGVIIFSIVNTQLLSAGLTWRNVLQFHSGIIFLVALSCMFYKPVPPTKVGRIVEEIKGDDDDDSISNESEEVASAFYSRVMDTDLETTRSRLNIETKSAMNLAVQKSRTTISKRNLCWCSKCCRNKRRERRPSLIHKKYIIEPSPFDRQDMFYAGVADYSKAEEAQAKDDINIITGQEEKAKQIAYTFSMMHTPSPAKLDDKKKEKKFVRSKFKRAINMLFDLSLLKMLEFQILVLSAVFFMLGLNIPYMYSAARSNISEAAKNALSPTLGVVNMAFRILAGYVSMKVKFHVGYLCGSGAVAGGLFVFMSAFFGDSSTWFQFVYICMFSAGTACFACLRSIIYVEILGLEKLTNSFGLTSLVMGVGSFAGTAVAGVLIDVTGKYMATFAFSGLCLVMAGALKIALPHIMKCKQRRLAKKALKSKTP